MTTPVKINKTVLHELLDEYIDDGDRPPSQIDSRFSECFDKDAIVSESVLSIKTIERINTVENLRRLFRFLLQVAEEHANEFKRVKVVSEDIAWAFSQLDKQSIIAGTVAMKQ